jgi:hypothetical protein
MALVALARMAASAGRTPRWEQEAVQAMADAVFAGAEDGTRGQASAESLARTAAAALATVSGGAERARSWAKARDTMPVPDGTLDVEALLDALVPRELSQSDLATALMRFAEPIQRAALASLRTSGDRARAVLDALGTGEGGLSPFVAPGASGPAAEKVRTIVAALEPSIVPLVRHPDPAIRIKAIALVSHSSSDAAVEGVVVGLEDPNEAVQRVALAAVGASATGHGIRPNERAISAVGKVLATHDAWPMRVLAAQALGRLGSAGAGPQASARLADAATRDVYALVRQAALEALASFDTPGARALASRMVTEDPEPRVREAAKALTK